MARPTLKQIRDTLCIKAFTVTVHYLDTNAFETIRYDIDTVTSDIANDTHHFIDALRKLEKLNKARVNSIWVNSATGELDLGIKVKCGGLDTVRGK